MTTDIHHVKSYIREHILELKTLKEIAARLNVCAETLRKEFLRSENIVISDFISDERIGKMKQLLETTDLRCFEICYMFGVREDSGAATFKRMVGISMESYRMIIRNNRGQGATKPTKRASKFPALKYSIQQEQKSDEKVSVKQKYATVL